MWLPIISSPFTRFDSHRSRENEFITFFICYMTLCDNVINGLCDFVDNRSRRSWETKFFVNHIIAWSRAQKIQWMVAFNYKPLYSIKSSSHRPRGSTNISWLNESRNFVGCDASAQLTSLPNVVAITFAEVQIWSTLRSNVRRRIHMIIFLQSLAIHFCRLFNIFTITKCVKVPFFIKYGRLLLQNVPGITKCDRLYYKVHQVLQNLTVIIKIYVTISNGLAMVNLRQSLTFLLQLFIKPVF